MDNILQTIQIGGQQALLTPAGQIIRAPQGTVLPANLLQGMTAQTVQLPNGNYTHNLFKKCLKIINGLWCNGMVEKTKLIDSNDNILSKKLYNFLVLV